MGKNKMIDSGKLVEMKKAGISNEEYVESCFYEMLTDYSLLDKMRLKHQIRQEIRRPITASSNGSEINNINNCKPRLWPNLDDLLHIKQDSTQEEMTQITTEIIDNDADESRPRIDLERINLTFRTINTAFSTRAYRYPWSEILSHSTVSITPLGDKSQCESRNSQILNFITPEHDIIAGSIVAGDTNDGKRAFLIVALKDGDRHILELKNFHILSLKDKDYNKEEGILTVFNKDREILYSDIIIGSPILPNAKPSFDVLENIEEWDGDENISFETGATTKAPNLTDTKPLSPSSVSSTKKRGRPKNMKQQNETSDDAPKEDDTAASSKETEIK